MTNDEGSYAEHRLISGIGSRLAGHLDDSCLQWEMVRARVRRSYFYRMAVVGGLFALMGSVMVWQGCKRGYWPMVLIGLAPTLGWLAFTVFEYRRGALELDATGVTRRDGKRFLWADLREVRRIHRRYQPGQQGPLNHLELHFPSGQARIFPFILENAGEVLALVEKIRPPRRDV